MDHEEFIQDISGRASGEAAIEQQLEDIRQKWSELAFEVAMYREQKDKFIIKSVEDIMTNLDDH